MTFYPIYTVIKVGQDHSVLENVEEALGVPNRHLPTGVKAGDLLKRVSPEFAPSRYLPAQPN